MSRQTVNLSKETNDVLDLYVKNRGVSTSSAISGIVADALDSWLAKQQSLGKKFLILPETNISGNIDKYRNNLISQQFSAIAINIAQDEKLSSNGLDMSKLFLKILETIVPDTLDPKQTKFFRKALANYFSTSDYFENWYENYAMMFPVERATFDSELIIHGYSRFTELEDFAFDIEEKEIIMTLIKTYQNQITEMLDDNRMKIINDFIKNEPDGLIIVNGGLSSGKTTLMTELALKTHLPIQTQEVRRFDNKEPLLKISSLNTPNNESVVERLHNIVLMEHIKPENLKSGTPLLLIHTELNKDAKADNNRYIRYVTDIVTTKY